MDDQIAEYSVLEKKSKQTGNTYKEFNFKFNFAIRDLFLNDLLTYTNSSPKKFEAFFKSPTQPYGC